MKNASTPLVVSLLAGIALFAGCTKQEQSNMNASVKETFADSKAAMANAWDNVKDFTYEQRNEFQASAKALGSRMDAQLSEVRANYSEANASASRKAAMAELKDSEADYKQKLDALGNATAATWDSAKKNVQLAWDKLQASYHKARAN